MTSQDKYLAPVYQSPRRLWVVSAACILVAAATGREYFATEERMYMLKQKAIKLHVPQPSAPRLSKAEEERNEHWKSLAAERAFNWYPIFKALESASNDAIELLEFEPDKANGQLILRGEAKNMEALVSYLAGISEQTIIDNAYLTHQKPGARESLRTISFEIKSSLKFDH